MTSRLRRILLASASGALLAAVAVPTLASASAQSVAAVAAGEDLPPTAVEDFAYPGAAEILQATGIKLIRGNGRLMLVDCDPATPQIKVYSRNGDACFRATGPDAYLTLEMTRVFALEAADQPISASLTAAGTTQAVTVAQGGYKSVGEGTVGGARSTLVELRVAG
ncbi:hypothetical protein [Kitasatospora sp. NPDC018619]|uniref:hypothetical protein n=1 Tax=unclassified Kitasatospora TaxID=2633591 RepID=UPI0037BCA99F